MMDAFVLDAAAMAAAVAGGLALRNRKPRLRRPAAPAVASLRRSIRDLRRRHRRAVREIVELARECLERHPDGSFEAYTARETVSSYLPETLAAYAAVPPALRRVRSDGGRTADDELSLQLRTLYRALAAIRETDAASGAARMRANRVFLEERFRQPELPPLALRRSVVAEMFDAFEAAVRRV